jgi:hypothetical protein
MTKHAGNALPLTADIVAIYRQLRDFLPVFAAGMTSYFAESLGINDGQGVIRTHANYGDISPFGLHGMAVVTPE